MTKAKNRTPSIDPATIAAAPTANSISALDGLSSRMFDPYYEYDMAIKQNMMSLYQGVPNHNSFNSKYHTNGRDVPYYESFKTLEAIGKEYIKYLEFNDYGSRMKDQLYDPPSHYSPTYSKNARQIREINDALYCISSVLSKADVYRQDCEHYQKKTRRDDLQFTETMTFLRRGVKVKEITPDMIQWCKDNYPDSHMILTDKKFFVFQEVAQAALFKTFWC
jgi:hypothetical protein